jgi:glutamate-ammonia-ligase adenylyltransferase
MQANSNTLAERLKETPLDDANGSGGRRLERFLASLQERGKDVPENAARFLGGVFSGSSFLSGFADRHPDLLHDILLACPEAQFETILSRTGNAAREAHSIRDIMKTLRQGKSEIALLVALADLGGVWSVGEITEKLSQAAALFLSAAVRYLLAQAAEAGQYLPEAPNSPERHSGLIVLAMGKFGAEELNYSSDIDLIVFFDRERTRLAPNVEAGAFFVRLTRSLVQIMQERTADGYVFRTDLRLRPDPGSTQAAISTDAAFRYYEALGQNWERAALIKAKPVAGDIAAGEEFLQELNPYIWRKYLDYNAIADIHAMKRQIHAAKGHSQIAVAGHNLKLGRGGIREIEFFVQSQQLIAGGRQPALRTRQTLVALEQLAKLDWISEEACRELSAAYRFLRRMEHRLQMVADQQTHSLPASPGELSQFSRFAGYERLTDFEAELRHHMQNVQRHYAALFESTPELTPRRVHGNLVFTGDTDDPATVETLGKLGFRNPSSAIAIVKGWHYGRYRAMRSASAREILTEFTPALLEALGETAEPDLALATFDKFLSEIPAALEFFSMLRSNPGLLRLLAQIMGSAPRLARILSRRRRLMDVILDPGYIGERPTEAELRSLIRREVTEAKSYEEKLNRARIFGQEQAFLIGAGLLSRQFTPAEAGKAYSLLAEVAIETVLDAVQQEFGGEFPLPAVIAMGKLGGREMTASSDVDLIVVYDAAAQLAPAHYARLTQRLISAISAPTSEGQLYAVDMRLRPSGKAGPVAVRFDGFLTYQMEQAWTWEHLALTRARVIAGPPELRKTLGEQIERVLTAPRNRAKAAADVREMRAMIEKEKATQDIWDTRNYNGGLVDVEFIAQFLQIGNAAGQPGILSQNTSQALRNLMKAGFLSPHQGEVLLCAAELYQNIAHILRLCTEGCFDPAAAPRDMLDLLFTVTGEPDLARLEARLRDTYVEVAGLFSALIQ